MRTICLRGRGRCSATPDFPSGRPLVEPKLRASEVSNCCCCFCKHKVQQLEMAPDTVKTVNSSTERISQLSDIDRVGLSEAELTND